MGLSRGGARESAAPALLLDWGDTVMRMRPDGVGPMHRWPAVEASPGVAAALGGLRGRLRVALATNAEDSTPGEIRLALARVHLDGLFDAVFTPANLGAPKPMLAFYGGALRALGVEPSRACMVGDDLRVDVDGARRSGLRAIWYNPRTPQRVEGDGIATIHDFRELAATLARLGLL